MSQHTRTEESVRSHFYRGKRVLTPYVFLRTLAALEKIPDLGRLEALIERIGTVDSW